MQVWDLRKNDILYRLRGHTDTVTGLQLSPDGSYLLSNSMDNTGQIYTKAIRKNKFVWNCHLDVSRPRREFFFHLLNLKFNYQKLVKNKNVHIKKKSVYILLMKFCQQGRYFNETGGSFKQTTILFWPNH